MAKPKKSPITLEVAWRDFDIDNPPKSRGVYAIFRGSECFYIGRSQNVCTRIKSNRHPIQITRGAIIGLTYKWIPVEEGEDAWVEAALIGKLKPEWNGGTSWNASTPNAKGPVCNCNCVSDEELLAAIGG